MFWFKIYKRARAAAREKVLQKRRGLWKNSLDRSVFSQIWGNGTKKKKKKEKRIFLNFLLLSFTPMSIPIMQNLVTGFFSGPFKVQGKKNTVRKPKMEGLIKYIREEKKCRKLSK